LVAPLRAIATISVRSSVLSLVSGTRITRAVSPGLNDTANCVVT
jgi:hypothetical protein